MSSTKRALEDSNDSAAQATKRKRTEEPRFYAVRKGFKPGVYSTWSECLTQITSFPGAIFKKFGTMQEAEGFVKNPLVRPSSKGVTKFYGVKNGRVPGIYTDWSSAEKQIKGWKMPRYKAFPTRAEAEAFMRGAEMGTTSDAKKGRKPAAPPKPDTDASKSDAAPGEGPLPTHAEDGFDERLKMNSETGALEYKTQEELQRVRMQATGLKKDATLKIWTDGSSVGNGKARARAGVGVYFGPSDNRNVTERLQGPRQTNQRAELTAIKKAIDIAPRDQNILIYSDSKYAISCVTDWFVAWRRNGWQTSTKKPVENKDLVEEVVDAIEDRTRCGSSTKFQWVKGHAADPGNVAADKLAVAGASKPLASPKQT